MKRLKDIMKNATFRFSKQDLYNKGFRYNTYLSNNHEDWYTLRFPVLFYDNKPTVEAEFAIELRDMVYRLNVYNVNTRDLYIPYYNNDFGKYTTIKMIERRIKKKLTDLGVKEGESNNED